MTNFGFQNDALAESLGLSQWIGVRRDDFDSAAVHDALAQLHASAERKLRHAVVPPCLRQNVLRLAALTGLSDTDCRVLEFSVLIASDHLLDDCADWLGPLSTVNVIHALAVVLALPEPDVRNALAPRAILTRSGLLSVDRTGSARLRGKLDLLSTTFADHIASTDADPLNLLRDLVAPSSPPGLALTDFEHLAPTLAILLPYLKHALAENRPGVAADRKLTQLEAFC